MAKHRNVSYANIYFGKRLVNTNESKEVGTSTNGRWYGNSLFQQFNFRHFLSRFLLYHDIFPADTYKNKTCIFNLEPVIIIFIIFTLFNFPSVWMWDCTHCLTRSQLASNTVHLTGQDRKHQWNENWKQPFQSEASQEWLHIKQ